ncbi:MAG TPA: hypothetical protein VLR92_04395, partial [Blastocatellia bacterium]|nr:hypothetical protein [Blastocatellia bacterium]
KGKRTAYFLRARPNPIWDVPFFLCDIDVEGPEDMTKQSYFSIVLIAIALLLTALAIMVVFTTPLQPR